MYIMFEYIGLYRSNSSIVYTIYIFIMFILERPTHFGLVFVYNFKKYTFTATKERDWFNVSQRLWRWSNIKLTLPQRLFAGYPLPFCAQIFVHPGTLDAWLFVIEIKV